MNLQRFYELPNWHFIWIAVLIAELFTALINAVNSLLWYGKFSRDVFLIGSIDALIVSFFVSLILILFLRNTRKMEELNQQLQDRIREKGVVEAALRESVIRYRTLFEKAGDAIFILDAEGPEKGKIVDVNQAAAAMHGFTVPELLGRNIRELDGDQASAEMPLRMARMLNGEWLQEEIIHRRREGTFFPVEINAGLLEIAGHKYILAIDRDVSLRKDAEKALQESERRYRTIFDNAQEGIWVIDPDLRTVLVNPQLAAMLGYDPAELLGRRVEDFVAERDLPKFRRHMKARKEGAPSQYELTFRHRDGSLIWTIVNGTPIHDAEGRITGAFGMIIDISERKKMEEALRESEERYRQIVENAPYSITITGLEDGRYLQVNEFFHRITGYGPEEVLGKTPFDLNLFVNPADRASFIKTFTEKGEVNEFELQYRAKDGRVLDTMLSARPVQLGGATCLLAMVRDITEEKRVRKEKEDLAVRLRQAQKMEAIGTLAGGIAHDFNNILTAILGYAELALLDVPRDTPANHDLSRVVEAGQRAKELVGQILAFTRKEEPELKPVSIGVLVKEAVKLMRAMIPSNVEIDLDLDPEAGMVVAEPTQIHQVIINLCTNGAQAMQKRGGTLKISLSRVYLTESLPAVYTRLAPGSYARLGIEDNGPGIENKILDRIFDPYFTTKEKGQGTGLGLSTVMGILKGHRGAITVESEAGRGSRFNVFLPAAETEISVGGWTGGRENFFPRGKERILLIDDEEPLTELGRKMLEKLGYLVTVRKNGPEALRDFKAAPGSFDLVITDQTMPKMLGTDFIKIIRRIRPDVPVILCTGYSDLEIAVLAGDLGIQGLIKKPYKLLELARTVRNAFPPSRAAAH